MKWDTLLPHMDIKNFHNTNKMAKKWLILRIENKTKTKEDMINQTYIYLLNAVENYQDNEKSFIGHLAFNEVIFSGRGEKKSNDPLNYSISLGTPISGNEEDIELFETLIDDTSTAYYERIEDTDYWEYMGNLVLEGARQVSTFTSDLFNTMIMYDLSLHQARKMLGGTDQERGQYQRAFEKGCRRIRNYIIKTVNQDNRNNKEDICFYEMGLTSWRHNRFTSGVEATVLRRLEANQRVTDTSDILY